MSFDYILLVKAELQNVNVIQKTITQRNTKANVKKWQREWEYIIPTFLPLKQIKSSVFLFLNYVLLDIIRVSILDPLLLTSKCHEIRLFLILWTQLRLHLYFLTCKSVLFLRLAHKTITWYLHLQLSARIKEYTLIRFLIYNWRFVARELESMQEEGRRHSELKKQRSY